MCSMENSYLRERYWKFIVIDRFKGQQFINELSQPNEK